MGARGVSLLTAVVLAAALSPVRPEPEPAQSPLKAGATKTTKNPYCSIACASGLPHTLCQYAAGPAARCKEGRQWPLSPEEKASVLHAHNLLRNKMASGGVPPFPAAANMRQMEWDSELEAIAQRWADQCSFSHDQCRDSGRFTVGQNVAIYFSSAAKFPPIESRVYSWYDEIRDYAYREGPFSFSFATGHFTQVVWGDTFLVGCGRSRYVDTLPTQLLVCNYGPGGNVETEPLYRRGAPCSGCSAGTGCSNTYPALCTAGQPSQAAAAVAFTLPSSTAAPAIFSTAQPAVGLRTFFANPTENSVLLPSSLAPGFTAFGGSTLKPAIAPKPFPSPKPTSARPPTTIRPFTAVSASTTPRPLAITARLSTTSRPVASTARSSTAGRPVTAGRALSSTTAKAPVKAPGTPRPPTSKAVAKPPGTPQANTNKAVAKASSPSTPTGQTGPRALFGLVSTTPSPAAQAVETPDESGCPIPRSVGPTCKDYRAAPLSASEKVAMLDYHNTKRSALASGEVPGFKPASDMKQMYWDEELEALAQVWADKCQWGHDPCRSTARWGVKGQNLGLTFSLNWTFPKTTGRDRVEDWFQELKLYNYSSGPFTFTPATSHFTQLAWADTYLVGCGRSRYMSEHGLPSEYLVCNYGPGGNIFGNALYREGPGCSRCPLSCSGRYPGLCQRSEDTNELSSDSATSLVETLKLDEPSSPPFLEGADKGVVALASRGGLTKPSAPVCPRPAGPGPNCIGHRAAPLTQDEKIVLLHRHNFYRSQVATGILQGLPSAASMLQMVWDDEVAALAQRWADQCSFGYDECAKTDSFRLGQSMAIWYSQDPSLFPPPEGRVEGWFNERSQANLSALVDTFKFSPTTAAFSQLSWADTWLLGCGRSRYASVGDILTEILVCNYGPGGNIQGGRMYEPGPPCSACPAGCSTAYPGLCVTTA